MIQRISTIRQRLSVGLNNESGSSSVIMLSLVMFILLLFAFLNIADYAVYSEKRDIISKSIDYAVTAAIQEIDLSLSAEGLSSAYNPATGSIQLKNIYLNETNANNAFYSTFAENTKIQRSHLENYILVVIVNPRSSDLQYILNSKEGRSVGYIATPTLLEARINTKLNNDAAVNERPDSHTIHVNGNIKTEQFKERPYYLVIVRSLPVKGLFSNHHTTFVSFKGANIERH